MKLRLLIANSRGLAAAAVAALALGIGITALMFAIVDGTVRRGLPVARAGEVVHLERVPPPGDDTRRSFLLEERASLEQTGALGAIAGYRQALTNIAAAGVSPRRWLTTLVTANTFDVLGVSAAHGRVFDAGQATANGVVPVLISDDAWRIQFGSDPSTVGRAIHANGVPAVIAGIMPPGFKFPFRHDVWMPIDERIGRTPVALWGRLAGGVSERDAGDRLSAGYKPAVTAPAASTQPARVRAAPFTAFILRAPIVQLLNTMFLAGLGVLVIACANVANLLLARGLARRRDFAIASALGASRGRIMRERISEGLALAAPGALLGILLTYGGAVVFSRAIAGSSPPYWVSILVDVRVLAYASAVAVLSALAASVVPSWRSGSAALSSTLTDEARGSTSGALRRTTAVLIIVEIALATGVLTAAGLMTKGITRLAAAEYEFAVDDVTAGRVSLPARVYPDPERRHAFFQTLYTRLQSVTASGVALGSSYPFAAADPVRVSLDRPGQTAEWSEVRGVAVSPGYFSTLGVRLISGRDFEPADGFSRGRVAIVNLSFALKYARREDLISRTIRIGSSDVTATIIGVAPDLAVGNARGEQPEAVYVPLFQQTSAPETIVVLARGDASGGALERSLRDTVAGIDPELALDGVTSLAQVRENATWFYRVFGFLFLAFGLGALVLALVGVYAVMSFGVTRRRREIGTRMAFGATGADIARMFLVEGFWRLAAGLLGGVLLAAWLAPRLSPFLFQVSPRDPSVYATAVLIVAAVGLTACALPALRAARQDPNACLREE